MIGLAWVIGILWVTFFLIAVAYKDDAVVRGAVRTMAVSIASIFADTKDLKNEIKREVRKELKKEESP